MGYLNFLNREWVEKDRHHSLDGYRYVCHDIGGDVARDELSEFGLAFGPSSIPQYSAEFKETLPNQEWIELEFQTFADRIEILSNKDIEKMTEELEAVFYMSKAYCQSCNLF